MAAEVVAAFSSVPPGLLVDGTVGGGGHAALLLAAREDCRLLGIDRDPDAIAAAGDRLKRFGDRVSLVHGGFEAIADLAGPGSATGVLLDLGVSSPQLDRAERGFSYRMDAPLDMRMDPEGALSAHHVVNEYTEAELSRVISRYGEERFARAIARRIVATRPITSTTGLAEVIRDATPAPARRTGPHPARRTFQAIRIEVNDELGHLDEGLDAAFAALVPGGRLAVMSYHSLEDRMVKHRFVSWSDLPPVPPGMPMLPDMPPPPARMVTRKAQRPGAPELAANPRAESVRLRVLERVGEGAER